MFKALDYEPENNVSHRMRQEPGASEFAGSLLRSGEQESLQMGNIWVTFRHIKVENQFSMTE